MVKRSIILVVVVVAVLAASAAGYANSFSGGGGAGSVTVNIQVANCVSNSCADTYAPRQFTVTEGQHVTIVFANYDDNAHELDIPAFGVSTNIVASGATTRVSFVPNQVGTFEYSEPTGVCSQGGIPCSGEQEMTGNMTVLAP